MQIFHHRFLSTNVHQKCCNIAIITTLKSISNVCWIGSERKNVAEKWNWTAIRLNLKRLNHAQSTSYTHRKYVRSRRFEAKSHRLEFSCCILVAEMTLYCFLSLDIAQISTEHVHVQQRKKTDLQYLPIEREHVKLLGQWKPNDTNNNKITRQAETILWKC